MTTARPRPRPRPVNTETTAQPVSPERDRVIGYVLTRRMTFGVETESMEEVMVPMFRTTPARVRVVGGVTRNLGDYNSARVEVSIEMPCLPEQSEVENMYQALSGQVDEMIRRELALATGETGEQNTSSTPQQQPPQPGQPPMPPHPSPPHAGGTGSNFTTF